MRVGKFGLSVGIEINLVLVSRHQNWLDFIVGIEIDFDFSVGIRFDLVFCVGVEKYFVLVCGSN